jgi:hypothetical protein
MDKVNRILSAQQQLRKTAIRNRKRIYEKQIRRFKRQIDYLPELSLLEELHIHGKVILLADDVGHPVERHLRGPYLFIARSKLNLSVQRNKPWNNDKKTRDYNPKNNFVADLQTVEIPLDIARPAFHKDQPVPKYYYARPPTVAILEEVHKADDEVSFLSHQVSIELWSKNRLNEANAGRKIPFLQGKCVHDKAGFYPKERTKIWVQVSILSLRQE